MHEKFMKAMELSLFLVLSAALVLQAAQHNLRTFAEGSANAVCMEQAQTSPAHSPAACIFSNIQLFHASLYVALASGKAMPAVRCAKQQSLCLVADISLQAV